MMASNWVNLSGQVIGQKYRLLDLLSAGPQQAWFAAEELASGRARPLSASVRMHRTGDSIRLEEFHHPNLRHAFASGEVDAAGRAASYSILENTGESLAAVLAQGTLTVEAAKQIACDVLSALDYLHGRGLVFCGLRPESVSRGEAGWVLSDYGWLRREGFIDPAESRQLLTSSPHVPPDAFNGLISPAWDIWSFGVLMNQALLAEASRRGRHHRQPPPPPPFDAVIPGCLNPEPARRTPIREISRLLGITLGGERTDADDAAPVREDIVLLEPATPVVQIEPAAEPEPQTAAPQPKRKARVYAAPVSAPEPAPRADLFRSKPAIELPPPPRRTRAEEWTEPASGRRRSAVIMFTVAALATGALIGVWQTRDPGEPVAQAGTTAKPAPGAADRQAAPVDPAAQRAAIQPFLDRWASTTRARDLNGHVATYADVVKPFFQQASAPVAAVRAEKERLFSRISAVRKLTIRDVRIESFQPDRAVVSFRKEWDMRGARNFAGAERERLTLGWFGNGWRITGEQEVRVYWSRGSI